ncbi:hypothetical protein [Chitinophaga niabensis]|uniref:Uncharacterized protein n=1 Tax=Chitinophaga niabensis TaxID=536979 RepID=A0A1N6E2N2_9BACT|nr:hypothetical protein [Chitinophaga niabensis]SIN77315.1 hypothetical protein SAMN04488055_1260 [Chitinophaga niabensis]
MKAGVNILFLQEKIGVLQATREFAFQLQKSRDSFDYKAALKSMGNKAIGIKYFYERSLNLVNWIYCHSTFSTVLKHHKQTICCVEVGSPASTLTSSFLLLQESALTLLGLLNDDLEKLEKEYASTGLRWTARNHMKEHKLGIDILKTIVRTRPEQFWNDMYEQGFRDSSIF